MLNSISLPEQSDSLDWIRKLAVQSDMTRCQLARAVCERFEWRDTQGRLKEMACRKGLRRLHDQGLIVLPKAKRVFSPAQPLPAVEQTPIAATLSELGDIELICVTGNSEHSRTWHALMQSHPLGGGPLCGAQLRYLIRCERGWLGALAFSAAARRLHARDTWLGWNDAERQTHLHHVVCNSRFLILPWVRVPHLASQVLALIRRRIGTDWVDRYGITPWLLETFVDQDHTGTCYRAASWIEVGQTRGRGRQDRQHRCAAGRKKVFLQLLEPQHFPHLAEAGAEPVMTDWADEEFGAVPLEPRLVRRCQEIARDFFARPSANIPQACNNWGRAKAAYRFFANPRTAMHDLLAGHYQATLKRCQEQPVVLAVCDSSALNYTAHPLTEGLGSIGSRQDGPIGLWLHETLAFTPEGVPLGLLDVQCWARDEARFGQKHDRKRRPIEDKESHKWLDSWAATTRAQTASPQTQFVMVADRESDIYELFAQARGANAQLLIRAGQSRKLAEETHCLWPHMQAQAVAGEVEVHVGRRDNQPARVARLSVRHDKVRLLPPQSRKQLGPVGVWAVWAQEISPPKDVEPLDWMLITTVPTDTPTQACERLAWYAKRWGIEIYHRILKSGCNIEDRQLAGADRLEACLAIDMVVAWRIMHLVHLNRTVPHLPATVYFNDMQWQALMVFSTRQPLPPQSPPTLNEAVRLVGRLGGHLGRQTDGEPGAETLWRGLQRLDDIVATYSIFVPQPMPPPTG